MLRDVIPVGKDDSNCKCWKRGLAREDVEVGAEMGGGATEEKSRLHCRIPSCGILVIQWREQYLYHMYLYPYKGRKQLGRRRG